MLAGLVAVPPGHRQLVIGIGGPAERLEKKLPKIEDQLRIELDRIANISVGRIEEGQPSPDTREMT